MPRACNALRIASAAALAKTAHGAGTWDAGRGRAGLKPAPTFYCATRNPVPVTLVLTPVSDI
ncbi:MAG: hypothetical protein LBM98_02175 [Oscillospiraceae bacterium]|nr:hypothetical protein [Oscillospiraceae bacterium]